MSVLYFFYLLMFIFGILASWTCDFCTSLHLPKPGKGPKFP